MNDFSPPSNPTSNGLLPGVVQPDYSNVHTNRGLDHDPQLAVIDIYPEGDLVINLSILDPCHKPWPAAVSDLGAPDIRVRVSSAVIFVASSGSGIGSTLKTLLELDRCDKSKRGKKGKKGAHSTPPVSPVCMEFFVSQGPGVRWYFKCRPTPRVVGVSPPTEVNLVLRLSAWETFIKGHRDALHNILKILHFQQPDWETKDGTLLSSYHLLGQVSELAWVLRCEKAIMPMIKLAQLSPPSDFSRSSMISRIRMAFVWKDADEFRKATTDYIFRLKVEDKNEPLGAGSETQQGKIGHKDLDEMGVMTFLQVPLYKARAKMIHGLFRVVADTYDSFVEPGDHTSSRFVTSSPLALRLLLGGLVKAMHWEFPGECYKILESNPQDGDSISLGYENQTPANIFSRLLTIKNELEAAWSLAKVCGRKVVELRCEGGAKDEKRAAMLMGSTIPTEYRVLPSPAVRFQAALDEVIKAQGLNLEDQPDPWPCDSNLGHIKPTYCGQ